MYTYIHFSRSILGYTAYIYIRSFKMSLLRVESIELYREMSGGVGHGMPQVGADSF